MKMNLKVNDKYKVTITSQENKGMGVCKINDFVVFVENGLPEEIGEVLITDVKKNFGYGKMLAFDKISDQRCVTPCPYYDECGGCDIQHQLYLYQLKFKEYKVKNSLEHIGGFKDIKINDIIYDKEFNYRNKVTLKVSKDTLGFYKKNTNDIIDIKYCMISNDNINNAIKVLQSFIKEHKDNTFKTIMIRSGNGLMIDIESDGYYLKDELKLTLSSHLDNLVSLILNDKVLYGKYHIEKQIDNFTFKLSSISFYQVNDIVMMKLYNKVIEHVSSIDNDVILDLYCGISLLLHY
jgi:23S rRNA (uracil1939-C5)-methyltransferase